MNIFSISRALWSQCVRRDPLIESSSDIAAVSHSKRSTRWAPRVRPTRKREKKKRKEKKIDEREPFSIERPKKRRERKSAEMKCLPWNARNGIRHRFVSTLEKNSVKLGKTRYSRETSNQLGKQPSSSFPIGHRTARNQMWSIRLRSDGRSR